MKKDWRIPSWITKPNQMFDLTGKVALVTGGASGLGRAIALGMDAFGANVIIADTNTIGSEEVAGELQNDCLVVKVDVTKESQVQKMVQKVLRKFNRIDISLNIPGINRRKPLLDLTTEDWKAVIDVNLTGVFLCAREVGKVMLKQCSGSMIMMASANALVGQAKQSVYSATKGGVVQLTKCLAVEWAPYVRVNAIAPGYVRTPLITQIMQDKVWFESMRDLHLLKRFAEPEEIVGAVVFLASEASSFITGIILPIDGGWTVV
jgi:NAD(P)-dependent dehydrogenase (short-subunit alcohol dehydrogenase family)